MPLDLPTGHQRVRVRDRRCPTVEPFGQQNPWKRRVAGMPSRSGQANEAGSVHRRAVAVYLAAHGLASRPVAAADPSPGNPTPVALAFETSHATDDLLCTLSDESRLFISAKRACGNDGQLQDTVDQWLAQVDDLQPGDRLVLATAEPKGVARHLGKALSRRRTAPTSVFPVKEQEALSALRKRMTDVPKEKQDRVLDAAAVLIVDADQPGRPQHDVASSLLEGTAVPAGFGVTALSHLESHLHTQAGSAYAGDVGTWVDHLVDLGVPVYADRRGAAGAAIRARQVAVERYQASLSAEAGRVDLTLLADDLEPLIVGDLAEHLQVTVDDPDGDRRPVALLPLARRRPRLLIEGLPGVGKSATMTQLAARWATERAAPLPILVRLRDFARSCQSPSDVTLARLCEGAASRAPANEQADLVEAMQESIARGEAVLLLDGLDECLDRRALVADGLKQVLAALPTETGVLLTTRPSGMTPAGRIALDAVRLTTPRNLDTVLDQLLRHVAEVRVPEADRNGWVAERARRVRDIRRAHEDLASVPLLSVLITLVVADSNDDSPPEHTAQVLHRAVTQTVSRWERRRPLLPEGTPPGPSDRQLLIGFETIGFLLSHHADASVPDLDAAVTSAMAARWGLAPEPAAEVADLVRRFWDDHVGVFVADPTGHVVPRSRVFAEIGAAMYCPTMPPDELANWTSAAVADPDRHTALLLAVQLDQRIIGELLKPGSDSDVRSRLAAAALHSGASLTAEQAAQLLDLLDHAGHIAATTAPPTPGPHTTGSATGKPTAKQLIAKLDERRLRRDGPVWPWALEIARLPLPACLEPRRAEALCALSVSEDQHLVARGIAVLTAADTSHRPLTPDERDDVLRMLAVPLPPKVELQHPSRRRLVIGQSVGLLTGLGQAAARAATRLGELDGRAVELITALAPRASSPDAIAISAAMRAHGHELKLAGLSPETFVLTQQASDDYRKGSFILLAAIADLGEEEVALTAAQRWRLPDLCDFIALLEDDSVSIPDFRAAVRLDSESTRALWIRTMALAADFDLSLLAAQARAALEEHEADDQIALPFEMASAWPVSGGQKLDFGRIKPVEPSAVVKLLTAQSDWIAESAARLLWDTCIPGLDEQVAALVPECPPARRFLVAVLCCILSAQPAVRAQSFFETEDPALRRAAAAVSQDDEHKPQLAVLRSQALRDADATIRIAAGAASLDEADVPPPAYWSCHWCAQRNDPHAEDCHSCDWGSRPRPGDL
jgi:hypothetical protein